MQIATANKPRAKDVKMKNLFELLLKKNRRLITPLRIIQQRKFIREKQSLHSANMPMMICQKKNRPRLRYL
jgi:hypothetical protein